MLRFRLTCGLAALAGVASVGCTLNRAEQCCPTDARRIVYSCAGQEAVRQGPCGPNEAYYGHHPTCWGSWPEGWKQYESDHCVTTAATADCDCKEPEAQIAVPVEMLETVEAPQPAVATPTIDASWPNTPLPEPEIKPITPAPAPVAEPVRTVTPAPALLPSPPTAPIEPSTSSRDGPLPTYEDLLRVRPVRSSSRPVFGPPPAPGSVDRY